jgi:GNAT superfamily N-acetyltransferase
MALAKILKLAGGKAGMLGQIGERMAGTGAAEVAKTVAPEVAEAAAKKAATEAEKMALRKKSLEIAERRLALMEQRAAAKAAPRPGPKAVPAPPKAPPTEGATALKPEPEFIPDEAVSLVAEPLPFRPRGSVKPATNLGGSARPGPAPTPDDKLAETLQASIDAAKAKKGAVLQGPPEINVNFNDSVTDSFKGQVNGRMKAVSNSGVELGHIDWAADAKSIKIQNIEVKPALRRRGIGTKLVEKLKAENPDLKLEWGGTTEDGAKLRAAVEGTAKKGAVRGKSPILDEALTNAEGMHQREATAGMTEAVADQRRRLGSQVVARKMGMGRHEVQSDAGTILNEALGEVSPVIPADRWAEIVSKMKSLPPEERVAYVARARGVKNMAQIENLRRTLETLGLLLPVGVAAASQE